MARLGDFCKIKSGYAFKSECFSDVGVPVIRIGNITSNGINIDYSICYDVSFWNDNPNYRVEKNEILVAMSGATVGKACINTLDMPLLLNQRVASIVCNNLVTQKYVYHIINSDKFLEYVIENSAGCAQPNISAKQLSNFQLIVPEIKIQKQIVTALDVLCNTIVLRKQQLAKLDELVKSRFVEMFDDPVINPRSWETAPLSRLIVTANNGMARRGKDEEGNIVLRLVELQNGFIDYSEPNRIKLTEAEKKRYRLIENDFLFARVNGNPDYVGRCAVFNDIGEPVYHNDHIIRVHFDESRINGCFTSVLLNSDYGKRQLKEQIKTSAGQYTISQDGIGAIITIIPPLQLQTEFATFVEQTDKSKFEIQKSLNQLETLKKALMQKYFG